ncbi:UTP--glucose-1-phosphate uridylyltransferase [uncultured Jatrophihabitans sp.]|uniref:UTP--glucose-1-phosphate uridylyltransferase n=1 Tax=uncultured Jatrophihabitans sp. TaxID=1610747 RepID=UPI0035CAD435
MPTQPVRKAVIPAAGRGTRFLPFTKAVPKELAPIVTTPAIELVVAEAAAAGVTDVLFVVSPGKGAIADYFGTDDDLAQALRAKDKQAELASIEAPTRLARTHFVDQLDPKGLGDAVAHAADFAAGEPVAVLLPDDVMDERDELLRPMLDVYAEYGGVVVGLLDVGPDEISSYGCVVPDDGADLKADVVPLADLVEKPAKQDAPSTLAIIGRYVLPPEIFAALESTAPGAGGEIQLTDAMLALRHSGVPVHGVVFRGRRYDTGNKLEYVKAVVQLAARHPDVGKEFRAWLREYEPDAD